MIRQQVKIFGKQILLKTHACNTVDGRGCEIAPSVNLFVKVTKACNAHCLFCSNAGCRPPQESFSVGKLTEIVDELLNNEISVNRINITGGEPSTVPHLVGEIIDGMSTDRFKSIHMHLNTNGLLPESQELMRHPRWDSISMSLHHYDIEKLSEIYACRISEDAFRMEGIQRWKLNASCNLIRGYIDNCREAKKMMDFTLSLGIPRLGFVALMKMNEYCRNHFIDLEDIHLDDIPRVHFTGSMNRGLNCKCSNYLYSEGLRILEIYMRNYANPEYCASSLVFDGEYLRQGFHNNNIIY